VAIKGYAQELLKHSTGVAELLQCDAMGVYKSNCHMVVAAVRGLKTHVYV